MQKLWSLRFFFGGDTTTSFCGSVSVVGPSVSVVAVGIEAAVVGTVGRVAVGTVGRVAVVVVVKAVGVDVAVANIASSGETVCNVGDDTVVDGLVAVDGLAVERAVGLCHGALPTFGSRGVERGGLPRRGAVAAGVTVG